ncbi:MAG TPA: ATP-binding protein [Steroidobacteraceae bacterium]|jgi:signal transduction histidine kinase/ActR/RegA family two-component response regulator|nr:ATP-binding protein [Steroidobacteraceae bacterium]
MAEASAQGGASGPAPGRPILFELARLAAVVALPLLGVIALLLFDAARRDLAHAADDTRRVADETAARSERFLGDFRATLETIAQRPLVRAMDAARCDPELSTLRELYPRAGNIIVVDAAGYILCGAKPPPSGERLRVADLELQNAVIRDGLFRLSPPLIGKISGTWGVTAVQPVRSDDGRVIGAVGMQINLHQLQPFGRVDRQRVIAGIVARPGTVIAHSDAPEQWIGKDVSGTPAIAAMLARGEGLLREAAFDDKDRLWAFRQVAGTDWIAYAGVDAESAIAPTRRRGLAALVFVTLIVGATIAAATYAARRIARPITAIAEVARARAGGARDARAAIDGPREVADVAVAFNAAQGRLQLQLNRLDLLHRITRAIGERHDLRSIFQVVIRSLEVDLPIDFGCICLHDEADRMLTVTLSSKPQLAEHERFAIDSNGLATCMGGQLIYEPDIRRTGSDLTQRLVAADLRALVISPLLAQGTVFGVLVVARREAHSFSSNECEFLRQLSDHVALATHQAQLYATLQQAYDDLQQSQQTVMQQERLRALGQMASGVAHDINNAIAPIALYTDSLLEHEPGLTDRARGYLSIIRRAIADVGETVKGMREFYRPQERQAALTQIDLNPIVTQVIEMTRVRWRDLPQQRGIAIAMRTELQPSLSAIRGQESEIRDALTNLIFNAVDAMPDGGTLSVRTRGSAEAVQLEVTDSGIGMDETTRRRCLEPFFTTKGERGTGLGLAMVYGMVRRHSAELEIDSTLHQGTTMRIVFPVVQVTAAAPPPTALESAPRPLSILIVDDDPLVLESLRATLQSDGHKVTTADGGQAGIDTFADAQRLDKAFDVVITDLGMPHVDGRRVAAAVKAASPATPIVLLTGWGQRLVEDGDIPAHVDHVLNKPPKLSDLRAALARVSG